MPAEIQKVLRIFKKNYTLIPLEVFTDPYEILVSTILSSRTKDEVTYEASTRLFKKAPTAKQLLKVNESDIAKLIYPVGFYKTKSKHLKQMAVKLLNDFQGHVPGTREELMSLPGVGRKTANLVLNRAFQKPAIAVDTHVHRITNLLGWVSTNFPHETEIELHKKIDQKYWSEINRLFVSIGRQYGTGRRLISFLKENKLI